MSVINRKDLVWLALDQFNKDGLLEDDEMVAGHFASLSRREVIRKVGFASVVALPVISSIVAPQASMAQSGPLLPLGTLCPGGPTTCASGFCANVTVGTPMGPTCCAGAGPPGGSRAPGSVINTCFDAAACTVSWCSVVVGLQR